jgi:hypothetical protein
MGLLAGVGVFRWPFLVVFLALPLVLVRRARPLLAAMPERPGGDGDRPLNGWLLVGLLWLPPLIFALASPVVPYVDVPPNHVAPVEHLRTFGALASISTTPDAYYGPSRILLGYQALLGVLDVTTGALAATAVAQFVVPLAGLVALSAWCLARAIGGARAGLWALLLVPISVTYFRLDDSRAGVLVFPLVALALWLAIEPLGTSQLRRVLVLGSAIGSAMLVHPLIGLYAAGFLAVGAVLRPSWHAGHVWPALAVGATLAIPQVAATAGLAIPAWTVILPIPLAVGVGFVAVKISQRAPVLERWVAPVLVGAVLIGGLLMVAMVRPEYLHAAVLRLWRDNGFAVTIAAALLAVLAWRRRGMELIVAAVITAIAVAIATIPLQQFGGLA